MAAAYYDDDKKENEIDPAVKKELTNNENLLPDNNQFEGQEAAEERRLVAIKKQKNVQGLDHGLEFSLLREIKLLQELNHPNIVKLYDVFHLKGLLFYALEYGAIDLGDLIIKERETVILEEAHVKCILK